MLENPSSILFSAVPSPIIEFRISVWCRTKTGTEIGVHCNLFNEVERLGVKGVLTTVIVITEGVLPVILILYVIKIS